MRYDNLFPGRAVIYFDDLKAAGIVRSRFGLHQLIKAGLIRKPHKRGPTTQAVAYWIRDEIVSDIEAMFSAERNAG